jgi:hypothetical protein
MSDATAIETHAPAHNYVWGAVAWSLAIVAVFAPLAVARYRRAAGA